MKEKGILGQVHAVGRVGRAVGAAGRSTQRPLLPPRSPPAYRRIALSKSSSTTAPTVAEISEPRRP